MTVPWANEASDETSDRIVCHSFEIEMKRTIAEPRWVFDKASLDLGMKCWHGLVVKGYLSTHKDVEYDSETPDIDLGTSIDLSIQQLGGGKVERPAEG